MKPGCQRAASRRAASGRAPSVDRPGWSPRFRSGFQSTDPAAEQSLTLLANARDTRDDASHRTGPQRDAALCQGARPARPGTGPGRPDRGQCNEIRHGQQLAELEQRLRASPTLPNIPRGDDDQSGPGAVGNHGDGGPAMRTPRRRSVDQGAIRRSRA